KITGIERLYQQPKNSLSSIYAIVAHELKNQAVFTENIRSIKINRSNFWETTLTVKWPENKSFKEIGRSKILATKTASWKCLQWLEMNGKLKNGKPIIYTQTELRNIQLKPVELSISADILKNMTNLIETYNTEIHGLMENTSNVYNLLNLPMSGHPVLGENVDTNIYLRNKTLKNRLLERHTDNAIILPIHEFKEEILSKLENNRVLLIEGDTGCGKTTQVPQFILDSFVRNGNATDCNILVSQPRRISAISLADRVANERNESVGDVVGFQVRLEQSLPKELGAIVFCTTGILLRKLQSNTNLEGCSHVILDEAHERSIETDMLMILLKRLLEKNPNLKVLIMSATINAHMFQQYFNCPTVRIPGRLYPVKMHFMEDIEHLPNIHKHKVYRSMHTRYEIETDKLMVDYEKIVQLIKWISAQKPPGAILCFLPGWNEIMNVQSMLEDTSLYSNRYLIVPMHSKVSHYDQRKIFQPTPADMRKVILATDIAETGITVSDVVYVIDSAIRKESQWDKDKDLPCISNQWVSRANIQQRKGRAGRVQAGESYHLITKKEYEKLKAHPLPEVLCSSLEKLILDTKTYTDEKAEKFLGGLLEPPTPIAIQKAIKNLVNLGIIDDEENLTTLGKRIALFPTHPKFSKALVYSSIFNCIHPVVTIASVFSSEDNMFYNVLNQKQVIRENKKLYHPASDHNAIAWLFKQWFVYNETNPRLLGKFCKEKMLRPTRMRILNEIRNKFILNLIHCRMLPKDIAYYDYNKSDVDINKYENNNELIRAVLYSATQQLMEHKNMGFKNGIMRKGVNELRIGRAKAVISGESVNYNRKDWPSSFLTYFNASHCDIRRCTVIREASMISPLTVLLFNQGETQFHELDDGRTKIEIELNARHKLRFTCDKETANVILEFRDIMWSLVHYTLETQGFAECNNSKQVFEYKDKLLETLSKILRVSSKSIENLNKISLS
ncbi:putative ATP-dependent RNA helicase DHX30, partial [Pogonomyrmex barbatus]|uniref:RNA helicase n=1 Tax=Pogonomyrmex barbatus TaxID=144034 RepID=A0A6I9WFX5_9HYME